MEHVLIQILNLYSFRSYKEGNYCMEIIFHSIEERDVFIRDNQWVKRYYDITLYKTEPKIILSDINPIINY